MWCSTNRNRPVLRPLLRVPGRSLYAVVLGSTAVHPGIEVLSCRSCVKVNLARIVLTQCLVELVLGVRLPHWDHSGTAAHAVSVGSLAWSAPCVCWGRPSLLLSPPDRTRACPSPLQARGGHWCPSMSIQLAGVFELGAFSRKPLFKVDEVAELG